MKGEARKVALINARNYCGASFFSNISKTTRPLGVCYDTINSTQRDTHHHLREQQRAFRATGY